MKIALLTQGFRTFAPEASNITLMILAEELSKNGHEVIIFCNQIWNQPLYEKIGKYKVIRQKSNYNNRITSIINSLNFSRIVKDEIENSQKKFDVIHNFSSSPLLAIRAILAKIYSKDAKLIQTIRSRTGYPFTYLFTGLLNSFTLVTVPNLDLKKHLNRFGLKNNKIRIIPSYFDAKKFKPRNKPALKRKHGLTDKKVILYYGHMSEAKGISYLIDAIELIKDEDFIALFVTGSGERFIKPYEELIKKKNLQNKIKIIKTPVKKTRNIEEYVAMADAVVLPYPNLISTEAQPSCVIESMASKTLVITSDLPELRELTGNNAIFTIPRNAESVAGKIKDALNKDDTARINESYKKAKEYDSKKIIKEYLKLYKK